MMMREPKCVDLKRIGAKHVATLLEGKNRHEILQFWKECTDKLRQRSQANSAADSANLHIDMCTCCGHTKGPKQKVASTFLE